MRRKKGGDKFIFIAIAVLAIGFLLTVYMQKNDDTNGIQTNSVTSQDDMQQTGVTANNTVQTDSVTPAGAVRDAGFTVHYIDVEQADSALIICEGEAMLIDAGEKSTSQDVINCIKSNGINELKYIVATHPHSDHIGGMADIVNEFKIENVIMPEAVHTTKTFENLIDAIDEKGLEITVPLPGDKFALGESVFTVLSPKAGEYSNLNNYSIVMKAVYGNNRFLFTGDAEKLIEEEMLEAGYDLGCDVLKVPHHGSKTSSSDSFINAAMPTYAIISSGENNDYGHPHETVLDRLNGINAIIYSTYEAGTITAISDGSNIEISGEK